MLCPYFFKDQEISKHWHEELFISFEGKRAVRQMNLAEDYHDYLIEDEKDKPSYLRLYTNNMLFSLHCPWLRDIYKLPYSMSTSVVDMPYFRIPCIRCPSWPSVADPWRKRPRFEGWPSNHVIEKIVDKGCLCIPNDTTKGTYITVWQYSFVLAENCLFQDGISPSQKYCYLLLSFICFCGLKCNKAVNTRVLKHAFFYACERIPSDFFETSTGSCILYILDKLQAGFQRGFIPNYFIPSDNLIRHLSSKQLKSVESQIHTFRVQPFGVLRQINNVLNLCTRGNSIIEKVAIDCEQFRLDNSIKQSTVNTFVPCLIDLARDKVNTCVYDSGLELLNQAFQDRLVVSTCDDSVLYQQFLQGSLSGLSLIDAVWFCTYIDKQLAGQLSKTMVREMFGHMTLTALANIFSKDVAGSFGEAEVPEMYVTNFDKLCHDFAAFLVFVGKVTEALPVLHFCVEKYKAENSSVEVHGRFDDFTMFYVYSGLYAIYFMRGQLEIFRSYVGEMGEIAKRLNTSGVCCCLSNIYRELGDEAKMQHFTLLEVTSQRSAFDENVIQNCKFWPRTYIMN